MPDPSHVPAVPPVSSSLLVMLDGGVVDADEPVVRADDAGLTRGDGCFEGCRLVRRPDGSATVHKLDRHLARMRRSAEALDIEFDVASWARLVAEAAAAWSAAKPDAPEASMKLLLSRGSVATGRPTGFAWVTALSPRLLRQRRDGVAVVTLDRGFEADAFAGRPWLLGGVKTLSYAINMAAQREAERRGADDVIFVNADGAVLEAPTAAVVWARSAERTMHTVPPGPSGILASTTVDLLFAEAATAGWQTSFASIYLDELLAADAVWLISSVRGVVEVVELDGKTRERRPDLDAEVRRLAGF